MKCLYNEIFQNGLFVFNGLYILKISFLNKIPFAALTASRDSTGSTVTLDIRAAWASTCCADRRTWSSCFIVEFPTQTDRRNHWPLSESFKSKVKAPKDVVNLKKSHFIRNWLNLLIYVPSYSRFIGLHKNKMGWTSRVTLRTDLEFRKSLIIN